jgi:methyl-accepting chemotaxis protein
MADARSRRTYLIDRSFQLKYALLLAGWGVVLALLFGAWAWQAHEQAAEILARDPAQLALLRQSDRLLLWVLAAIGLLTAAALGLLGFVMSHRVAGPVWVLGHALAELAKGRYPARRGLRRGDELKSLHARFQEAVEAIAARDRRTLDALEVALSRLRSAAAADPWLAPALAALEEEARLRRDALAAPR